MQMIHPFLLRKTVEKLRILLGSQIFDEVSLQKTHARLLKEGFYLQLRKSFDSIYSETRQFIEGKGAEAILPGLTIGDINLGFTQKTVLRTTDSLTFNKSVAHAKLNETSIWFPIKRSWQIRLEESGLEFNRLACLILYFTYEYLSVLKSLFTMIQQQRSIVKKISFNERIPITERLSGNQIFLFGLNHTNFPSLNQESNTLYEWIQNYFGSDFLYTTDLSSSNYTAPPNCEIQLQNTLISRISYLDYMRSLTCLIRMIAINVFKRRVPFFELLSQVDEILIGIQYKIGIRNSKYKYVVFPSTVLIAKPLWANILEYLKTTVILLNYTALAEPLSPKETRVINGIWHLSNWKDMYVVDSAQTSQMKSMSLYSSKNFEEVGVPYWSGKKLQLKREKGINYVAAFDTHIRSNRVFSAGVLDEMGWNNLELERLFIEIILEAAIEFDLVVLHKKKRSVAEVDKVHQENLHDSLQRKFGNSYRSMSENYSPESIISISSACVSKPISTTALIAAEMGIPSIILDPTGNLQPNDPGLRMCNLVYSRVQLCEVFTSEFRKKIAT